MLNTVSRVSAACWLVLVASPTSATAEPLEPVASWTCGGGVPESNFGFTVAWAGDVNSDGYEDVLVGDSAWTTSASVTGTGRAYLFDGSGEGVSATPSWHVDGEEFNCRLGVSVAGAGDVDGDGFDDVVVGADGYDAAAQDGGAARVYLGSATGPGLTASWEAQGSTFDGGFGCSVASAGDVNNDGFSDVLVGADGYEHGEVNEGAAFLYLGSATGLSEEPVWSGESNQTNAGYGSVVLGVGDVNGDGYPDIAVGGDRYSSEFEYAGRVWVYYGGASGFSPEASWTADGSTQNAYFGSHLAASDLEGDGYSDLVVGADGYGPTTVLQFRGSSTGLESSSSWSSQPGEPGASVGLGDVNGDGLGDLLVGAPHYDSDELGEGRVVLFLGAEDGFGASPDWVHEGDQAGGWYGFAVALGGDANGDGLGDAVIGSHVFDDHYGRAWAHLACADQDGDGDGDCSPPGGDDDDTGSAEAEIPPSGGCEDCSANNAPGSGVRWLSVLVMVLVVRRCRGRRNQPGSVGDLP